jgi:hypothetical protein
MLMQIITIPLSRRERTTATAAGRGRLVAGLNEALLDHRHSLAMPHFRVRDFSQTA